MSENEKIANSKSQIANQNNDKCPKCGAALAAKTARIRWIRDGLSYVFENDSGDVLVSFGFASDFEAMQWADMVVLVLPCGRSAHLEAGWFIGAGKPAVIYVPEPVEPELMYLLAGEAPGLWMATQLCEVYTCVARAGHFVFKKNGLTSAKKAFQQEGLKDSCERSGDE